MRALAPVRRPVPLARMDAPGGRAQASQLFGGRQIELWSSGTQALTAALVECCRRRPVADPEAILPAYGCPDLVTACVAAGVRPRLVDVAGDRWGFDPTNVEAAGNAHTVAIVAVNLLGLGDAAESLQPIAQRLGAALVQDSAQHLPRAAVTWPGDYVVLSFGRGKPLNLLRGGALVGGASVASPHGTASAPVEADGLMGTRFAALLFNLASSPPFYGLIAALPGLSLGTTRYKSPRSPTRLPEAAWGQVGAGLRQYALKPSYDARLWSEVLPHWQSLGLEQLQAADACFNHERLRLALLAPDRATRDRIVTTLDGAGLGASPFYGRALNELEDVPDDVRRQGPFPHATRLADRLFTLPTHGGVTSYIVAKADALMRAMLAR